MATGTAAELTQPSRVLVIPVAIDDLRQLILNIEK